MENLPIDFIKKEIYGHLNKSDIFLLSLVSKHFKRIFSHGTRKDIKVKFLMPNISVQLIQFLFDIGLKKQISWKICDFAARYNKFEILKWACDNGCRMFGTIYIEACKNGNFDIIKFAHKKHISWWKINNTIYDILSKKGYLEIFKWFYEKRCRINNIQRVLQLVARGGHFEMLKWIYTNVNGSSLTYFIFSAAVEGGNFDIIQWLHENNCPWVNRIFVIAVLNKSKNRMEIIKWLCEKNYSWDEEAPAAAAYAGNFKLLKWFKENGCSFNGQTLEAAAQTGNFTIVKWLHQQQCPRSNNICMNAALSGQFEILKWLVVNNYFCDESLYENVIDNKLYTWKRFKLNLTEEKRLEMLKWILENTGILPRNSNLCEKAAYTGFLEILKWLRQNNCPWDETICTKAAINKHYKLLKWACENGCPHDHDKLCCANKIEKN